MRTKTESVGVYGIVRRIVICPEDLRQCVGEISEIDSGRTATLFADGRQFV